jgi:hypothetical protein
MNVQPLELDCADVKGFARLKAERSAKAELLEADERIRCVHCGTDRNAPHLGRRPDAQSAALRLKTVRERHMKAVQLDAGVKALFQGCHNVGAEERLRSAQDDQDGHRKGNQQHKQTAG